MARNCNAAWSQAVSNMMAALRGTMKRDFIGHDPTVTTSIQAIYRVRSYYMCRRRKVFLARVQNRDIYGYAMVRRLRLRS